MVATQGRKRSKADSGIAEKQGQLITVNYNILTMIINMCVKSQVVCEIPLHCTANISV